VQARALDQQGNALPTLPQVVSLNTAVATVTVDTVRSGDPTPITFFTVRAVAYGKTNVIASAGSVEDTLVVQTWPAQIVLGGLPDSMRVGETATLTVSPVDVSGNLLANVPVDSITIVAENPEDPATGNPLVRMSLDRATLVATAGPLKGSGKITASGQGGSEGSIGVAVIPALPATAAFSAALFPALKSGDTSSLEVVVKDAGGNVSNLAFDLLGISAVSSDPSVATVATRIVDDTLVDGGLERHLFVTATAVVPGSADITASVTTTGGTFVLGAAPANVFDPQLTVASPSGGFATNITINGTGLTAAGFATDVLVDGKKLGNLISVSNTQIVAQAPTFGTAGTWDLEVSVGGVLSNKDTWTQVGDFDPAAFVPANDLPETAPQISVPALFTGQFSGTAFVNDFFRFTLSDDQSVRFQISWTPAKDLDFILSDCFVSADVFSFTCYAGTFIDPSGGTATPALTAGDYLAWVNDFDAEVNGVGTDVVYTFSIERP